MSESFIKPRITVRELKHVNLPKKKPVINHKKLEGVRKYGQKWQKQSIYEGNSVDCPRWNKAAKLFNSIISTNKKEEISQVQGISVQKQIWKSPEGSSLLGASLFKSPDHQGQCQIMASTISAQHGARLAATLIDTNSKTNLDKKLPKNSIYTAGNSFHPKDTIISYNSIRHRIKNFVYVSTQRAFLCYCPNELVIRGYKVDLSTDNWVEVLRMPVYPSMNDIKYCELTDEVYGASRGALTIWKMVPLGTGRELELVPPEKSFQTSQYIKERDWVYHLRIFGYVLCALLSNKIILFHCENKQILDIIVPHHLSAPISDVFLWFKNMEIGLKDDTIAMLIASKDGSISLLSNINVQTLRDNF